MTAPTGVFRHGKFRSQICVRTFRRLFVSDGPCAHCMAGRQQQQMRRPRRCVPGVETHRKIHVVGISFRFLARLRYFLFVFVFIYRMR